ncbi:hypothetical protein T35B1_18418 [Salinisphaera shabanensis T35B1]|uniref:hypothetical protein n=1 Tax=Salinisphaera shabanensis TaxID=180542 RepID=UPI0033409693
MRSTTDRIEQDFRDALERLKANKPMHKALANKVRLGKKVRINVSNVALEAGRSRTLIGTKKNCRYPNVRQAILQTAKPVVPEHTAEYAIRTLREANAALNEENRLLLSVHAALLRRADRLEKDTKRRLRDAERRADQKRPALRTDRSSNSLSTGTVLHFPGLIGSDQDDER